MKMCGKPSLWNYVKIILLFVLTTNSIEAQSTTDEATIVTTILTTTTVPQTTTDRDTLTTETPTTTDTTTTTGPPMTNYQATTPTFGPAPTTETITATTTPTTTPTTSKPTTTALTTTESTTTASTTTEPTTTSQATTPTAEPAPTTETITATTTPTTTPTTSKPTTTALTTTESTTTASTTTEPTTTSQATTPTAEPAPTTETITSTTTPTTTPTTTELTTHQATAPTAEPAPNTETITTTVEVTTILAADSTTVHVPCEALIPTNYVVTSSNGSELVLECGIGYKQTGGIHMHCVNNTLVETLPECLPVVCGKVLINDTNNFNNFSGEGVYGTMFSFACYSGYYLEDERTYARVYCNARGKWEAPDYSAFDFRCKGNMHYIGCYDDNLIDNSSLAMDAINNPNDCRIECHKHYTYYYALYNSSCWCVNDTRIKDELRVNNSECNAPCSDNLETGYCGGASGKISFYSTFEGFYDDPTIHEAVLSVRIPDDFISNEQQIKICQQYCYGSDILFSLVDKSTDTCYCHGSINPDATQMTTSQLYVRKSDFKRTRYVSCVDLYKGGIYIHGNYSVGVADREAPTFCQFKDDTVCDNGWIGYRGACYLFNDEDRPFYDATEFCFSHNATMVSILDEEELNFVVNFMKNTLKGRLETFYLGLYRNEDDGSFMWTDGSLMQFTAFIGSEPKMSDDDTTCAVLIYKGYEDMVWESVKCNTDAKTICKKKGNYQCVAAEQLDATTNSSTMSLTHCILTCQGQNTLLAATQNDQCWCIDNDTISGAEYKPLSECNTVCMGNNGQRCGGPGHYTVTNVDGFKPAMSCKELDLYGISGRQFFTEEESKYEYCPISECSMSWMSAGNSTSCYKFISTGMDVKEASKYCGKYDAYLMTADDDVESDNIINVLNSIMQFSKRSIWMTGLYGYFSMRHTRWANGQLGLYFTGHSGERSYGLVKSSGEFSTPECSIQMSVICEMSSHYLGCYAINSTTSTNTTSELTVTTPQFMSVQLCIEWCRSRNTSYAMLGEYYTCSCSDELYTKVNGSQCDRFCYKVQPCGGEENVYSVYSIDEYEMYNSCVELYETGISVSGYYRLNSSYQFCRFYDNVTECEDGWIGYQGRCFIVVTVEPNSYQKNVCRSYGGEWATIYDADYHNVLYNYMAGIQTSADSTVLGLRNNFQLAIFTWASGEITEYLPLPSKPNAPFVQQKKSKRGTFDDENEKGIDGNPVLCEKRTDNVGCFNMSGFSAVLVVSTWMELTLCKQLCIGNNFTHAGIQDFSCNCFDHADLQRMREMNKTECSIECPGNQYQECGYGDTVNVFILENSTLATSCKGLYRFGVLRNSSYRINSTEGEIVTNCGFADDTWCEPGWYGRNGICYRVHLDKMHFNNAVNECHNDEAFLFSPTDKEFIQQFLSIPPFIVYLPWWTGFIDRFGNQRYLHGNGSRFIAKDPYFASYFDPSGPSGQWHFLSVDVNSTHFNRIANSTQTSTFVCQKASDSTVGYVGCFEFQPPTASPSFQHSAMTATMCIQYCLGTDYQLCGITKLTHCYCLDVAEPHIISSSSSSCTSCPGYPTQACGNTTTAVSLYNLTYYEDDLFESCNELQDYGVTVPAKYYIKPHNFISRIQVSCFDYESSLMGLQLSLPLESRISWPYTELSFWKSNSNLTVGGVSHTYKNFVVITGVVTQGGVLTDAWTTSYKLQYYDEVSRRTETYTVNGTIQQFEGNSDSSGFKYNYLINPIITKKLTVKPITWYNWPVLRVEIIGTALTNYNFFSNQGECFRMTSSLLDKANETSETDPEICGNRSESNGFPFWSFYNETCVMWPELPVTYGKLDYFNCTESGGLVVRKSYGKLCDPLPVIPYSQTTIEYLGPEFFTFGTTVQILCNTGYIFPDLNLTKSFTCQQDNTWTGQPDACQDVYCNLPLIPDNATVDSNDTAFESILRVTCGIGFITPSGQIEQVLQCTKSAQWNASLETCEVMNCSAPPDIQHASSHVEDTTYGNEVVYTCAAHTWFWELQNKTATAVCTYSGWNVTALACNYYDCSQPPSMLHADVTIVNETTAEYTCHDHYAFNSGAPSRFTECQSDLTWETVEDNCVRQDDEICYRSSQATIHHSKLRSSDVDVLTELPAMDVFGCSHACLAVWNCSACNFMNGACRLYSSLVMVENLSHDDQSVYIQWGDPEDEVIRGCN